MAEQQQDMFSPHGGVRPAGEGHNPNCGSDRNPSPSPGPGEQQQAPGLGPALEAKREGINRASANNARWLARARDVAKAMARQNGTVTAEDVRRHMEYLGLHPSHPNAWGCIFPRHRL